jgi:hypothetical protein
MEESEEYFYHGVPHDGSAVMSNSVVKILKLDRGLIITSMRHPATHRSIRRSSIRFMRLRLHPARRSAHPARIFVQRAIQIPPALRRSALFRLPLTRSRDPHWPACVTRRFSFDDADNQFVQHISQQRISRRFD